MLLIKLFSYDTTIWYFLLIYIALYLSYSIYSVDYFNPCCFKPTWLSLFCATTDIMLAASFTFIECFFLYNVSEWWHSTKHSWNNVIQKLMTILDELMLHFSYTTPTIQNSRVSKIFLYEIILIFWQGYVTLIKSDKKNIYNVTKYLCFK